tara:strand:+ start:303 stop:518 length:216 start_codon:yes stop_codon:yes gene_type:complete
VIIFVVIINLRNTLILCKEEKTLGTTINIAKIHSMCMIGVAKILIFEEKNIYSRMVDIDIKNKNIISGLGR